MAVGGICSESLPLEAGVTQDSILGPVLINGMSANIDLQCRQYADDTTFIVRSVDIIQSTKLIMSLNGYPHGWLCGDNLQRPKNGL